MNSNSLEVNFLPGRRGWMFAVSLHLVWTVRESVPDPLHQTLSVPGLDLPHTDLGVSLPGAGCPATVGVDTFVQSGPALAVLLTALVLLDQSPAVHSPQGGSGRTLLRLQDEERSNLPHTQLVVGAHCW